MTKYSSRQIMYIRKNRELFFPHSKFNSYDVNLTESEEHDFEILKQFFYLRWIGCFVAVRQTLLNGSKPDIAVLSSEELIVKEVMVSESTQRFMNKDYLGARKIPIRIKNVKTNRM